MGFDVDRILFLHRIEDEPGKTTKGPQYQNHGEDSREDGHPESVLVQVAQSHPDGDNGGKNDIGDKECRKEEHGPESQVFQRQWLARNHFVIFCNLCRRKFTWFFTLLSTLILCSMTSEAYRTVE